MVSDNHNNIDFIHCQSQLKPFNDFYLSIHWEKRQILRSLRLLYSTSLPLSSLCCSHWTSMSVSLPHSAPSVGTFILAAFSCIRSNLLHVKGETLPLRQNAPDLFDQDSKTAILAHCTVSFRMAIPRMVCTFEWD